MKYVATSTIIYNHKYRLVLDQPNARRSKSEETLHNLLCERFPELTIISNSKSIIPPLEIDIAIPSLRIAIEWNGIFHRKPIGGKKRFEKRKKRDAQKKIRLAEMKWDLYLVETNSKYNKEYIILIYNNICDRINNKRNITEDKWTIGCHSI